MFSASIEVEPVENLNELLEWNLEKFPELMLANIPLKPRTDRPPGVPKTLVCHDMMGSYLDDRFVQGSDNHHAYRFFHWSQVDIFIYFSHKFITIPPPGWIDSGHLHGVPVLGTIITESEDGYKICQNMLADELMVSKVVEQLCAIAKHHRFDGWLINIENNVEPALLENLVTFVRLLTERSHEILPGSIIIWYDSVTYPQGKVLWQDELNSLNKIFFNYCDGIFLNYGWKEAHLQRSLENAGVRTADVYVGIDVFGRGTIHDEGLGVEKGIRMAREKGLSVAIFAIGYTYEQLSKQKRLAEFTSKEYKFWANILELLPTHGPSFLPFCTSFCQGYGLKYHHKGEPVHGSTWHNLSLQQYQPTVHCLYNREDSFPCKMTIHNDTAFDGGGCLRLSGTLPKAFNPAFTLFECAIPLNEPFVLSYAWKSRLPPYSPSATDLCMMLTSRHGSDGKSKTIRHFLGCREDENRVSSDPTHCRDRSETAAVADLVVKKKWKYPVTTQDLQGLMQATGAYICRTNEEWNQRCYVERDLQSDEIVSHVAIEVLVENSTEPQPVDLLLGHFMIVPISALKASAEQRLQVFSDHIEVESTSTTDRVDSMDVSCVLRWTEAAVPDLVFCYVVYCELKWANQQKTVYVGVTKKNHFRIWKLKLPNPFPSRYTLRFLVTEHKHLFPSPTIDGAASTAPVEF